MAATGQTINDRLNAVRYALVGQGLARAVCKATTEEVLGPKRKHIDYLLTCSNEPNVSIPQMANLLIERTQNTSWTVVFKGLITIHHLMSQGNERFMQYLATTNHSFELNDFLDRTSPQGYSMSNFVRTYAKYVNDKTISYRTLALDLCKIRSGNDNALRTMNMDNLSKTLPIVQRQFDSLLEFGAESKDLNNGIIMAAFRLLYKDLVKLYVAYQEAIINLLERYFKLSRRKTREALDMYKKYLNRMDKVAGFLRLVESVGLDKSEMPDLTDSPASILKVLEEHLAGLEAKKRGGATSGSPEPEQQSSGQEQAEKQAETKQTEVVKSPVDKSQTDEPTVSREAPERPTSSASSTAGIGPKKHTPPARPSPKVSPKVSPSSGPKNPAPDPAPQPQPTQTPTPTPTPTSVAERKASPVPPERPAKPPSRPPPPASTGAPGPSSGPENQAKKSTTTAVESQAVSPPPHPPPPKDASHPPATTTSTTGQHTNTTEAQQETPEVASQEPQEAEQMVEAELTQQETDTGSGEAVNNNNETASDQPTTTSEQDGDATLPSCSATSAAAAASTLSATETDSGQHSAGLLEGSPAVNGGSNEVGLNHVNEANSGGQVNGDNRHSDLPPPPPPLDGDELDATFGQAAQQEAPIEEVHAPSPPPPLEAESDEQPQMNGGNNGNNERNNNSNGVDE